MNTLPNEMFLQDWARGLGIELPKGYKPDPIRLTEGEARLIFRELGVIPELANVNFVLKSVLTAFPDLDKAFYAKLQEGYKMVSFKYELDERTGHESVDVTLSKGYEKFVLSQGKGAYAGGYSHCTFGREGERAAVL